jgi:hypothetical protein
MVTRPPRRSGPSPKKSTAPLSLPSDLALPCSAGTDETSASSSHGDGQCGSRCWGAVGVRRVPPRRIKARSGNVCKRRERRRAVGTRKAEGRGTPDGGTRCDTRTARFASERCPPDLRPAPRDATSTDLYRCPGTPYGALHTVGQPCRAAPEPSICTAQTPHTARARSCLRARRPITAGPGRSARSRARWAGRRRARNQPRWHRPARCRDGSRCPFRPSHRRADRRPGSARSRSRS